MYFRIKCLDCDSQMADPVPPSPAETSSVPPAGSSDAGLEPELQEGEKEQGLLSGLRSPAGPEEKKEEAEERTFNQLIPPQLHLRKGTDTDV